jgi:hypothetical protein
MLLLDYWGDKKFDINEVIAIVYEKAGYNELSAVMAGEDELLNYFLNDTEQFVVFKPYKKPVSSEQLMFERKND